MSCCSSSCSSYVSPRPAPDGRGERECVCLVVVASTSSFFSKAPPFPFQLATNAPLPPPTTGKRGGLLGESLSRWKRRSNQGEGRGGMTAFDLEGGGGGALDTAPRTRGRRRRGMEGRRGIGRARWLPPPDAGPVGSSWKKKKGFLPHPRSAPLGVFFAGVSFRFAAIPKRRFSLFCWLLPTKKDFLCSKKIN